MKLLTPFFIVILLFTKADLQAQEFSMPADITKFAAEDCGKYKNDIIQCINWLQQSPMSKDKDKRHVSDAFLLTWISHCPEVSIEVRPYLDKFNDVSPEFVSLFMGAFAKYEMESGDKDELNCNIAAVKSLIEHYIADKEMIRSAFMDKLIALDAKGKLKEWVIKAMKEK